jgi:hypothetical protein
MPLRLGKRRLRLRLAGVLLALVATGVQPSASWAQASSSSDSATVTGTIRGRFQEGVRVLSYAMVEARTPTGRRVAVADSAGRYVLAGLPAGEVHLRASATGHAPMRLTASVVAGRSITLDLELTAAPLALEGVDVSADSARTLVLEPGGAVSPRTPAPDPGVEMALLEISPSVGEAGMLDAVQALPGNDPSDPSDILFMRGSTTELKLVLLDGIPVFTPFHVAGLMRSFEPTVLRSANLHVGGAPARYDGGLSHILDLRTRPARRDRVRATGSADFLSASVAAESPIGDRAGLIASARSLHDLAEGPLGGERPYGYRDVLVSVDLDPAESHNVRATGFWNEESVLLDFDAGASDAQWSNRALSATYSALLGAARLQVSAGASRYRASLPLQPTQRPGEEAAAPLLASARSDRARVATEVAWGETAPLRVGLALEEQAAVFSAQSLGEGGGSRSEGSTTLLGVYMETSRPLRPDVTVRVGLRGDLFSGDDVRLAPRVALFWEFGPDALISVAAGRYHQAGRTPEPQVEETLTEVANREAGSGPLLPIATADHVVVTLTQRLGGAVTLGLDGYWKRFEGLRGEADESILNSGLDLRLQSAGERGSLWLGYGLSWYWSPLDLSGSSNDFAGRHLLSAGVSGELMGPLSGEARLAYGAGLPSTSIPFGSNDVAESTGPGLETLASGNGSVPGVSPLEASFLRLDVELHAVFEPSWGGRPWRVRPYLRLLNALDRRDALFYTYQPWRSDEVTPLAERPILPVLGVAFSF